MYVRVYIYIFWGFFELVGGREGDKLWSGIVGVFFFWYFAAVKLCFVFVLKL